MTAAYLTKKAKDAEGGEFNAALQDQDGTGASVALVHALRDSTGTNVNPATSDLQTAANASLASISASTATAANQTTANASLSAIAAATGTQADAAYVSGSGGVIALLKGIFGKLSGGIGVTGTFWQATQPISAASLPLPAGAAREAGGNLAIIATNSGTQATAANQTAANASLLAIATATGAQADTAYVFGSGGIIALLKGIFAKLSGAATDATITALAQPATTQITGTAGLSALNTDVLSGTVGGWYDAGLYRSMTAEVFGSAGISAGMIIVEQTDNPAFDAIGMSVHYYTQTGGFIWNGALAVAASSRSSFTLNLTMRYVRLRISTAFVGGTVQATATFAPQPTMAFMGLAATNQASGISGGVNAVAVTVGTGSGVLLAAGAAAKFITVSVPATAANGVWVNWAAGAATMAPPSEYLAPGAVRSWYAFAGYLPTQAINAIATASTSITVVYK
jgi:hypothetical protein